MQGYLVTFFTQRSREYDGLSLAAWIVEEARKLGVRGATLSSGQQGFGHDGRSHSDNFFEQEDPPQQVAMAMTRCECDKLMAVLAEHHLRVFYTKAEVEFGFTSQG